MRKTYIFLILMAVGILGRWVVMPSVKRMKTEELKKAQLQKKVEASSCIKLASCSINDLLSAKLAYSSNKNEVREYVLKNKQ